MTQREPTAAQALWGHLRQGTPDPLQRSEGQRNESVAQAMYPQHNSRSAQSKPARESGGYDDRESLLRNLRAINARSQRQGAR
jgi:hypothetical protein